MDYGFQYLLEPKILSSAHAMSVRLPTFATREWSVTVPSRLLLENRRLACSTLIYCAFAITKQSLKVSKLTTWEDFDHPMLLGLLITYSGFCNLQGALCPLDGATRAGCMNK